MSWKGANRPKSWIIALLVLQISTSKSTKEACLLHAVRRPCAFTVHKKRSESTNEILPLSERHQDHSSTPTVTNSRQVVRRNRFDAFAQNRSVLEVPRVWKRAQLSQSELQKHDCSFSQSLYAPLHIRNTFFRFFVGLYTLWSLRSLVFGAPHQLSWIAGPTYDHRRAPKKVAAFHLIE